MSLENYIASFYKLRNQAAMADEHDDLQVWLFLQGLTPERLCAGCLTNGLRMLQEAIDVATHLEPLYGYTAPRDWLSKHDVDKAHKTDKVQICTDRAWRDNRGNTTTAVA